MKIARTHFEEYIYSTGIKKPAHEVTVDDLAEFFANTISKAQEANIDFNPNRYIFELSYVVGFIENNYKSYHIAKDFAEVLKVVKTDVKPDLINLTGTIHISFPVMPFHVHAKNSEKYFINGAYVQSVNDTDNDYYAKGIRIIFCLVDKNNNVLPHTSGITMGTDLIKHGNTVSKCIELIFDQYKDTATYYDIENMTEVLTFIANCLLYIQSGQPDLRAFKKAKPKKVKNFEEWYKKTKHDSIFSTTLVGFDYKKPKTIAGEHSVRGHWRWQPYGEGREKVKLIWIKDHIRGAEL